MEAAQQWIPESEERFHRIIAVVLLCSGVSAFVTLLTQPAPYGRFSTPKGWGPLVNARFAWFWMESPNLYISALCWIWGSEKCRQSLVNRVLLGLFVGHYINRALIYPLRMQGGRPMPVSVMLMAQAFCTVNGYLQARFLTKGTVYDASWLRDPRFLVGTALFVLGWALNLQSDSILRNLRKPGEIGYKIPRGGLFEYVSGANYTAEILEWAGFALASWSLPAAVFAAFTALNIGPRAMAHHRYYREKFEDYPTTRKALIPFIL